MCRRVLAPFPGSPRARTKNRKERGEPGKIYHMRNVTGREDLIARGQIKPQHSVRPLVMQVSSWEDGAFCYTICKFRKSLWSSFWRPWRQMKKTRCNGVNDGRRRPDILEQWWRRLMHMDAEVDCRSDILEQWWRRLMHIWHGTARIVVSKKIIF